jgi:hypothetical protein
MQWMIISNHFYILIKVIHILNKIKANMHKLQFVITFPKIQFCTQYQNTLRSVKFILKVGYHF